MTEDEDDGYPAHGYWTLSRIVICVLAAIVGAVSAAALVIDHLHSESDFISTPCLQDAPADWDMSPDIPDVAPCGDG